MAACLRVQSDGVDDWVCWHRSDSCDLVTKKNYPDLANDLPLKATSPEVGVCSVSSQGKNDGIRRLMIRLMLCGTLAYADASPISRGNPRMRMKTLTILTLIAARPVIGGNFTTHLSTISRSLSPGTKFGLNYVEGPLTYSETPFSSYIRAKRIPHYR